MANNTIIAQKIAQIYDGLDSQIKSSTQLAGSCKACGKCCDFNSYDHRLYITTLELIYLQEALGKNNIKAMANGICPYNIDDKCSIHNHRFAACRIFCCNGDKDFQGTLSEVTLRKLKSVCDEFEIPYTYCELATALNSLQRD